MQFLSHCLIHMIMLGMHLAAVVFTAGLGLLLTVPLHMLIWLVAARSAK